MKQKFVTVAPQIAPFAIAEEPANWGDSISVVCAILKGDLPIEITWALNGVPIRPDRSDINILATTRKNSILSIESVAARHAGEYTCSASNKAGATSHSATLAVNGTSHPRDSAPPVFAPLNLSAPYHCPLSIIVSSKSSSMVNDGGLLEASYDRKDTQSHCTLTSTLRPSRSCRLASHSRYTGTIVCSL